MYALQFLWFFSSVSALIVLPVSIQISVHMQVYLSSNESGCCHETPRDL